MSGANDLVYSYSDPPFKNWSIPASVAADAADLAFDAVMDNDGNVYVAYVENMSYTLATRKLSFSEGAWSVGSVAYVFDGTGCFTPSITIDVNERLWASWSHLVTGDFELRVKISDDGGATWGSGPSDPGDVIKSELTACYSRLVVSSVKAYAVFSCNGNALEMMTRTLTGGEWSSEFTIATGSALDDHFDVAVTGSGLLGVVWDDGEILYREFDGTSWGSIKTLDDVEAKYPQLIFMGNVPLLTYMADLGQDQHVLKMIHRRSGSFSEPELLEKRASLLDSLILYDSISTSYADLSDAAASAEEADVYHPSTGSLVKGSGDAAYLGMNWPFRFIRILLSVSGTAGTIGFSYFNGSNWVNFEPAGGSYHLDAADKGLLLWEDIVSIPTDWQKFSVNGVSHYWVKMEVVSEFASGPIGSRFSTASTMRAFSGGR